MSITAMFGTPRQKLAEQHEDLKPLGIPTHCPECRYPVKMIGEYLICPNTKSCPAQIAGAIKTWVNKLNILEWGDSLIETLCADGLVTTIDDLYRLEISQIANVKLTGKLVGESTAKKVIANLHAKKEIPLSLLIGSLGIPMIGQSMAKLITQAGFDTLDKMTSATAKQLSKVRGLGDVKAESFVSGLQEKLPQIHKLFAVGITLKNLSSGPLYKKAFCMSGFRDPLMVEAIENAGGTLKSGVSRGLDYLISFDVHSTTGKAKKARDYGVPIISQEQLWEMVSP